MLTQMENHKKMKKINAFLKDFFHKKEHDLPKTPASLYKCPGCGKIINPAYKIKELSIFTCPYCSQKGFIRPAQQKHKDIITGPSEPMILYPALNNERKNKSVPIVDVKILGVLLIIIGVLLYFVFNLISLKGGIVTIIIGVIIYAFIPSNRKIFLDFKKTQSNEKPRNDIKTRGSSLINHLNNSLITKFDISEKIAILLILWIIFIYMLTGINDIDIFFIFVYLGILLMKVFSTEYISSQLKKRINVFTVAFLFIFIIIIIRRIITIAVI